MTTTHTIPCPLCGAEHSTNHSIAPEHDLCDACRTVPGAGRPRGTGKGPREGRRDRVLYVRLDAAEDAALERVRGEDGRPEAVRRLIREADRRR